MAFCDSNRPLKRICAIHDLSCFGRCALTVIMPTLSAMGYQVVPLPTALLSTHTGGFTDMHFVDLGGSMEKIAAHFGELGLGFDSVYSGFLGSETQIETVERFVDEFAGENTLVMVDPVMGDDGELYSTYTHELMMGMKRLCKKADIITPNLTEAFFLTETEFTDTSHLSKSEALTLARELKDKLIPFGNKQIVITGIPYDKNRFATYGFDTARGEEHFYAVDRIKRGYPGTGDLFASVLLGKLLAGESFYSSLAFASDFICEVMEYSSRFDTPLRDGVAFEAFLGELAPRKDNENTKL